jgi:lysophospholipid acyltransferase (LPLAT)-like uncharacterized protein
VKLQKRIVKNKSFQSFLCWLVHIYIKFVYLTSRWDVRGSEHMDALVESGKPFIIAFWHGRLLMIPPFAPKGVKINVLISNHSDGALSAKVMGHFKLGIIRGSSKKDGLTAFRNIMKALKRNEAVVITPDGPRGPRMQVSGTIISIAQMMSVPIIPMTYSTSSCRVLRSWDRFLVAKPFARSTFIYGEPIFIDKKITEKDVKKAGLELEKALNEITRRADEAVGLKPLEPDCAII